MRTYAFVFLIGVVPALSVGAEDLVTKLRLKSVEQATEDFLKTVPSDETIEGWIKINGPVYGNYCGVKQSEATYDSPCLSRLDCVCKAQAFGKALKTALATDMPAIESILGKETLVQDPRIDYQIFLQKISIKLFAAKLKGLDITQDVKAAHLGFLKQRDKAMKAFNNVIDENEVVREKIETINVERIRFEELRVEANPDLDFGPKIRSVSTQPFNIIAGLFSLSYEQAVSGLVSLRVGVSFLGTGLITDTYLGYGNNKDFSAFASFGVKTFVTGQPLKSGVYIEPFVDVGYENVAIRNRPELPNVRDIAVVPALMFGFEKVFPAGIHIDLGIGGGYHLGIPVADNPTSTSAMFFVPKFRGSVGWAW